MLLFLLTFLEHIFSFNRFASLNNMTQEQLANALYLDTQYYAQLERGERNFTIEKIILACTIFHVGIENIIVIEDSSVNDNSELLEKIIHDIVFNQNTLIHGKTKPRSHLKRNRGFASILITRKLSLSGSVLPDFDLKFLILSLLLLSCFFGVLLALGVALGGVYDNDKTENDKQDSDD